MKIYVRPERENYFVETAEDNTLMLMEKAKVVAIAKDYIWDTRLETDEKKRNYYENLNMTIMGKLKFMGVLSINENGYELDISEVEPIDVYKAEKEEKELEQTFNSYQDFMDDASVDTNRI